MLDPAGICITANFEMRVTITVVQGILFNLLSNEM